MNSVWNSHRTQIILANNRRHYICVKCDNVFGRFPISAYTICFVLLLWSSFRRQCRIIEIPCNLPNWPFVYYMIYVRTFRNPEHVLAVGNGRTVEISFFSNCHSLLVPLVSYNSQYLWRPLTARRMPRGRRR